MPEIADWLKTLGMSEYAERSGEGKERGVVGETLNLAARLQALAEPNAVVIRPQTQRLLGNPFEHHDLGAVEMRGFPEPMHAYLVAARRSTVVDNKKPEHRPGLPTQHDRAGRILMLSFLVPRSIVGPLNLSRAAVAAVIALIAAWPLASKGAGQASPESPDVFTPLVASVLAPPQPVLGDDDRIHIVYELFVTNPTTSVMQLDAIETLASARLTGDDQAQVLARLAGPDLQAAIKPFSRETALSIGPAQVSRVFLDLAREPGTPIPPALAHRFDVKLVKQDGGTTTATVVSGFTTVSRDMAVVLDPPLVGNRWLVGVGCCFPPTIHRTATLAVNGAFHAAQRFAIDFVQLDADGRLFTGPKDKLSSYAFYGADVHAAAGGVVVDVLNDVPDTVAGKFPEHPTAQELLGNHVVIDIGGGRFTFYAHLKPGSVRVRVGEHVARSQTIGLLGNSGNTDAPHLHFHVMDGPSPLASNGLPFRFRSFNSEGAVTTDIEHLQDGATALITPALAGAHQDQMPLEYHLLSFPPIPSKG